MNKAKLNEIMKNKKLILILVLVLVGLICLMLLRGFLSPNGSISKYGNRLDGIENVRISKSDKNDIAKKICESDKVSDCKIDIQGKIINVMFNVSKDTTIDDAKNISNDSMKNFSKKIKSFYDIQYIITNKDEEGTKQTITDKDGKETEIVVKNFPIMGYKNSSSKELVW